MRDLVAWLLSKIDPNEGPEAAALHRLITERRAEIEAAPDIAGVRATVAEAAIRERLPNMLVAFDAAVEAFQQAGSPAMRPEPQTVEAERPAEPAGWWRTVLPYAGGAAVASLALSLLAVMAFFLVSTEHLTLIADIGVARGLITFLFTVGTIGIAVLMVSALFLAEATNLDQRFDRGKEVLTALIAILGTVVGFYFGSETSSGGTVSGIEIGAPVVFPTPAAAGGEFQLTALVSGGTPPLSYSIDLRSTDETLNRDLQDIGGRKTESGLITETLRLPAAAAGKPVLVDIAVSDEAGSSANLTGIEVEVRPSAEEPPAPDSSGQNETPPAEGVSK